MHSSISSASFRPQFIAALACTALFGCTSMPLGQQGSQADYERAISDAAVASPQKINKLLPIPAGDVVDVVSWVTEKRVPCAADNLPCEFKVGVDRMWVTLAGEVQQRCQSWGLSGDPLRRRLEQLLGLPPDSPPQYQKVAFVLMQVPRASLGRPCLGLDLSNPDQPTCTVGNTPEQPAEMRSYAAQQMAGSYFVNVAGRVGYPFTRLGYTYDWHPDAAARGHYGASEFVVAPDTGATVIKQIATDAYCATGSARN